MTQLLLCRSIRISYPSVSLPSALILCLPLGNLLPFLLCSLCPAYNICEQCEAGPYMHDPNHVLLKLRRPVLGPADSHGPVEGTPRMPATLEQVR